MDGWLLVPGIVLIAAGCPLQFGSWLRRPRDTRMIVTGVRLRFIGFGTLLLGAAVGSGIAGVRAGFDPVWIALALFLVAMAGARFHAATGRNFSVKRRE